MPDPEESIAQMFQRKLKIQPALAERLVEGHFTCIEEVAYMPFAELLEVSGLSHEDATSLRGIAARYLLNDELGDEF
jgi:transcription termination/antitermination protein NusA